MDDVHFWSPSGGQTPDRIVSPGSVCGCVPVAFLSFCYQEEVPCSCWFVCFLIVSSARHNPSTLNTACLFSNAGLVLDPWPMDHDQHDCPRPICPQITIIGCCFFRFLGLKTKNKTWNKKKPPSSHYTGSGLVRTECHRPNSHTYTHTHTQTEADSTEYYR